MGTLTANSTRLPEYCEHKLPTSCRLSSIPNCCACADERAHAASYSTYIDGVGFVLRGKRWQRYCWFCKEFWEQRVKVSGLRSGQTRIPEAPDQTEFLKKWYEFHQGYRIVLKEDGSEERVAVLGEEFKDVSPGCLPRTLEELRAGRRREEEVQIVQNTATQGQPDNGTSLEDTLEQMFAAASLESDGQSAQPSNVSTAVPQQSPLATREAPPSSNIHAQAMNPAGSRNREYQMRRVAALRRELNRMRNGIERVITGLRDLGEEVPNYSETTGRLTALGDTLDTISGAPSQEDAQSAINSVNELANSATVQAGTDRTMANLQARVDEARMTMEESRRARDQVASELDLAEQEFRTSQHRFHQIQREQRTTENYMRIFGTREEVIAQGENYVSPIGSMFSRAEERFRAAEDVRREQRTLRQVLEDEGRSSSEDVVRRLTELGDIRFDVWGVPQPESRAAAVEATRGSAEQALRTLGSVLNGSAAMQSERPTAENDIETPPTLIPTAEESQLEEYYALLRRQDQNRSESDPNIPTSASATTDQPRQHPVNNFTQDMLDAIVAARERELVERNGQSGSPQEGEAARRDNEQLLPAPPTDETAATFSPEAWWHEDANHIIRALASNEELRNEIGMSPQEASVLLAYFIDDVVSEHDRMLIDGLMRNPTAIWLTGLPAEWIRRRQDGPRYPLWEFFSGSGFTGAIDWAANINPYLQTEVMAQAYQMSASVRHLARALTPPERLQMLYRVQAGRRDEPDVRVLEGMRDDRDTYACALSLYRLRLVPRLPEDAVEERVNEVDDARREMARNGDHSRDELNARRRDTTHAFALAAGRQAMQTGGQALFDRFAGEDEGTRAAYRRLESNNFLGRPPPRTTLYRQLSLTDYLRNGSDTSTDTDSDKDDAEAEPRGLDAQNTGRPEPKADEELTVQMECKICYTQLAEVACLPCGHLVMCRWCSEQHSPTMQQDRTRPRRAAACPVCRKGVRQKVRVFRA